MKQYSKFFPSPNHDFYLILAGQRFTNKEVRELPLGKGEILRKQQQKTHTKKSRVEQAPNLGRYRE